MASLSELVSKHIRERWKQPECRLCGANNWVMNGPFGLVPVGVDERGYITGFQTPETGSPVVAMVCYECGHTTLIDYNVIMGLDP